MEPKPNTPEARVLHRLREQRSFGGAASIEGLYESAQIDTVRKGLQRVISNLRGMGFEVTPWWDKRPRKVYAYSLEAEAVAADPFRYLSSLIRKQRLEVFFGGYLIRVDWFPMLKGKTVAVQLFPKQGKGYEKEASEHYVIGKNGVGSFGWNEKVSGASPTIPTMSVAISGVFPSQEERMLIDHIRAHIVQNFIREALEKGRKRTARSKR